MKIPFQIIPALSFLIAVSYYYQFTAQYTPRTLGDWNYTTGMDHVHAPLLVIHGERDTLGFDAQNTWASALSNGHVMTIPKAGFERNWEMVRSISCHMTS